MQGGISAALVLLLLPQWVAVFLTTSPSINLASAQGHQRRAAGNLGLGDWEPQEL